ncbi:MAG: hypothetical protein ACTS79_01355 [Arsenophonus sp. ET-KM2-MAG3]
MRKTNKGKENHKTSQVSTSKLLNVIRKVIRLIEFNKTSNQR